MHLLRILNLVPFIKDVLDCGLIVVAVVVLLLPTFPLLPSPFLLSSSSITKGREEKGVHKAMEAGKWLLEN